MEKKRLVPWFCSAEWYSVFVKIYGDDYNKITRRDALEVLKIWKSRTPLLQSGVEGTLIILEAILLDNTNLDDYNARLLQSTSVMRFLNICAANDNRQGTFYQTAKKRKIPEWIISLRHDAAHSQNLPSKDILCRALAFCLGWLYKRYWIPVSKNIKDFVDSSNVESIQYEILKNSLEPFVINYGYINLSMHPIWSYTTIQSITDQDAKKTMTADLKALLDYENINDSTKITQILHFFWMNIQKILLEYDTKKKNYVLAELMLESDIFLCSLDNFNLIFEDVETTTMPKSFLFLWEKLLKNMHTLGMMPALLQKLLQLVNNQQETHQRRIVAALWLAELGKAFTKCVLAQNIFKIIQPKIKGKISAKQLNLKLKNKCEQIKPKMGDILTLSLTSDIPELLTNYDKFKKLVLISPNEFSNIYLPYLLNVNKSLKSNETKKNILKLVKLYVNSDCKKSSLKIFTIDDLHNLTLQSNPTQSNKSYHSTYNSERNMDNTIGTINGTMSNEKRWKKLTDVDLRKCPIGLLPWQTTTVNPFLGKSV